MKILNIIKRYYLWLIIPALLYLVFFLIFPAFNIIDDGASLLNAKKLADGVSLTNWRSILVENSVGRLRPLYHLYFFFVYILFGTNPFFYWLLQFFILTATLICMAMILNKITKHYFLSGFTPILLLLYSPTAANYYRLGTAEPKQLLLWLLLFLVIIKFDKNILTIKKIFAYISLFILSLLMKETSILFISLIATHTFWTYLFNKPNKAKVTLSFVLSIIFVLFLVFAIPKGNYGSGYKISFEAMKSNFFVTKLEHSAIYIPLLTFVIATFTRFIKALKNRKIKEKDYIWQFVIFVQICLFLLGGILPWQHQLVRYHYPIYIMVLLYIAIETKYWLPILKKQLISFDEKLMQYFVLIITGLSFIQVFIFKNAQLFSISINNISNQIHEFILTKPYVLFFLITGIALTIIRISVRKINLTRVKISIHDFKFQIYISITSLVALIITQLIWKQPLMKTTFLIIFPIFIYLIYELFAWKKEFKNATRLKNKIGPLLAIATTTIYILLIINSSLFNRQGLAIEKILFAPIYHLTTSFDTHQVSYVLIDYLLDQTEENAHVYVLTDGYEITFEIGLYASKLQNRPITVFTDNKQLIADLQSDYPYLQYDKNPIESFLSDKSPKILIMRQVTWNILQGETHEFLIPEYANQYIKSNVFLPYTYTTLDTKVNFGTIPKWANWAIISK